jgi:hypothetical protein
MVFMLFKVNASSRWLCTALVVCGLWACTTTYGPKGLTGGYKEEMIQPHIYKVTFDGNGNTSQEMVFNYWVYHCAELTISKGYAYFGLASSALPAQLVNPNTERNVPLLKQPDEPRAYDPLPKDGDDLVPSEPPRSAPMPSPLARPAVYRPGTEAAAHIAVKSAPTYIYVPGQTVTVTSWHKTATIAMYKSRFGATTPDQRFSLHAQTVIDVLKPYVTSAGQVAAPARQQLIDAALKAPLEQLNERATPPDFVAGLTKAGIVGDWLGKYKCGVYKGTGQVDNPSGWTVPVTMTVAGTQVTMVRQASSYRETLMGVVAPDLTVALKGQGALLKTPERPWHTQIAGRFSTETNNTVRFEGQGQLADPRGTVSRDCTVELVRKVAG